MIKKLSKYTPLFVVVILSIFPLFDLFHAGLPNTHDGQDHLARIANFYLALSDGVLVPRWAGNLNWGFGHPILMFLYPLPSYAASIFHFIGLNYIDSLKIVFVLSFIFSGVGMYLWIRKIFGIYAGITAAVLYMFAPYRFVNLYVRGAIGEHVSFAFIPFVLFFITNLLTDKKITKRKLVLNILGISFFTGALILSHNALSILFLLFTFFYAAILAFYNKKVKQFIIVIFGIIYGFLLSAFFWLPAFMEGKYTLRDIVTGNSEYALRFVDPFKIFIPSWSYGITGQLSVQIGVVHIALILISIFALVKFKNNIINKKIFIVTFIFFAFSLFMMVKESNFIWASFSTLQKFQFPWRFLSLTVLSSALLGSYFLTFVKKRNHFVIIFIILCTAIFFFYSTYWKANGFLIKDDGFFNKVYYGTTDTGESGPIWSIRFMEEEALSPIEVISGRALIQEEFRSSVRHKYLVVAQERSQIRENTLYFPGWSVYVDGRKLDISEIEFQDAKNRGVMTFFVDAGEHNMELVFTDTKLRMMANAISLLSFIVLLTLALIGFVKKNEKNNK